ncbi:hypothetical protein BU17DRAFT_69461 [Hysterangium stoloniferum]|nr:hypothetical protein BU17DRAFT_69461 [Hysterangium stoloniferum]
MAHFLKLSEGLDILPVTLVFPLFINTVLLPHFTLKLSLVPNVVITLLLFSMLLYTIRGLWVFALEWKWQRNKASDQPTSASSAPGTSSRHLPLLGVLTYRPKFINKKWEKAFEVDWYMVKGT